MKHGWCRSIVTGFVLAVATLGTQYGLNLDLAEGVQSKDAAEHHVAADARTIRFGDLPGYTGWSRPSASLASTFRVSDETVFEPGNAVVGNNYTFSVSTDHPSGQHGGALFYIRAYGKSIITGTVADHKNGSYDVTVFPFEEGMLTLELVLDFSDHPDWSTFPVSVEKQSAYEGFMVPTFPRTVLVSQNTGILSSDLHDVRAGNTTTTNNDDDDRMMCQAADLFETSPQSGLYLGRWSAVSKTTSENYGDYSMTTAISSDSYFTGEHGLGIKLDFEPKGCKLLSSAIVQNQTFLDYLVPIIGHLKQRPHVIFVGDSNMVRQYHAFRHLFNHTNRLWDTSYVGTKGGILPKINEIRDKMDSFARKNHMFFVLFNSGLHDIHELCGANRKKDRSDYIDTPDDLFSCSETYGEAVDLFVDTILRLPAAFHVWQSSTAAWPKWGNYGVPWPVSTFQTLPKTTHVAEHFNRVAWEVIRKRNVSSLDAYWLTLARPDHREVAENPAHAVGNKLVHAGPEIYSVMARELLMLILDEIAPDYRSFLSM